MTNFKSSTVIVVGGAGFVGSALVRRVLRDDPTKIIIVDNLLSADIRNVPIDPRVEFRPGSITADKILAGLPENADYVFHLATYHGNQSSMHDPLADHENNTLTTLKLLERLKAFKNLKKVVYSSAGCTVAQKTFDDAEATTEEDPVSLWLDSPYQISKIIGEFYGNYYFLRHQIPFVKARFQNVYGPGEILGAGQWRGTPATVWRNVTPTFIWKSLHHDGLPVENGGIATRDFIYVDDIAEGLAACALRGKPGDTFNIASGVETSVKELAELVNELTGNPTPIALQPARAWDRSGKRYGDPSKAEKDLGFRAKVTLRDGMTQTVAWTRANQAMIQSCIDRHLVFMPELQNPKDRQAA